MPDFTNAQIGDSVYSLIHGKGKIYSIRDNSVTLYPIVVSFENSKGNLAFTLDGKSQNNAENSILFWEKPDIIEKKRKVKKTIECYIVVCKSQVECQIYVDTFMNKNDFDPEEYDQILFGPEKRTIEYEVEE